MIAGVIDMLFVVVVVHNVAVEHAVWPISEGAK
jgi:hypothetical protein